MCKYGDDENYDPYYIEEGAIGDDDYYIFFVDPDYGYANEEDCDEDNNL